MQRKLSILFVSEYFYPRAAGGEIWAFDLCTGLAARGHRVTVLTCRQKDDVAHEITNGIRIYRPVGCGSNRITRALATTWLLGSVREYLKTHKVDIIHTTAYTMNTNVSAFAKKMNMPCIPSVHAFFGEDWKVISPLGFVLRKAEKRALLTDTSKVMHVPSSYVQRRIKKDTKKNTVVIHNWIPNKIPKQKKLSKGTLLFVGSLEPIKNPLACILVAKTLKKKLIVIGNGSLKKKLVVTAKKNTVNCTVLDNLSHEKTLSYIGGASLVLVPSITESFCLVALEAIAQGTPVAGTKVGILSELPGIVSFPPKSVPKRLSKKIVRHVQRAFRKEKSIREFETLYQKIIKKKN